MGKYLTDIFPTMNSLKQGDAIWPLPCNFVLEYGILGSEKKQKIATEWNTSPSSLCWWH